MYLRFRIAFATSALFLAYVAHAQTAPDAQLATHPSPAILPSAILQSAISDVQGTTSSLNISKWKAPESIRAAAQENVDSIQRDLGNTLPSLLAKADASPESVPPSFAVYRNLDALYDVLLRVDEVASIAAPSGEADAVSSSLQRLEAARSQLGDSILHASQHREAQIVVLETAVKSADVAPPAPKKEIIVDDGPVKTHTRRIRSKTAKKKPETKPASAKPAAAAPTKSPGH
jgi:hypothetical protein